MTIAVRDLQRTTHGARSEEARAELKEAVNELFTFAPWIDEQKRQGEPVNEALQAAYLAVIENVPSGPTRSRALNAITDARMLANQAITFRG